MGMVHLHRHVRDRIVVDADSGCWNWTGTISSFGYAIVRIDGTPHRVHRLVYRTLRGALDDSVSLHHECENKRCVNPDHLVEMDPAEHARLHQTGKTMNLPDEERERRSEHGRAMIHHASEKAYTKTTRQAAGKKMWANRTPEQRAEIGRKISEAKRRAKS